MSFVEMAFVLAIAGIVLGRIWVAYGAVAQKYVTDKTAGDLHTILYAARNHPEVVLFPDDPGCNQKYANAAGAVVYDSWDDLDLTPAFAAAGIIPGDMLVSGYKSGMQSPGVNPWGGGEGGSFVIDGRTDTNACDIPGNAYGESDHPATARQTSLSFVFRRMPSGGCVALLQSYANEWAAMGIRRVCVQSCADGARFTSREDAVAHLTPDAIASWCKASGAGKVDLTMLFGWPPL